MKLRITIILYSLFLVEFQAHAQPDPTSAQSSLTFSSGLTFFEGINVVDDKTPLLDIYSPRAFALNLSALYNFHLKKGYYISLGINMGNINFRTLNNTDSTGEFESRNNTFKSIIGTSQSFYLQPRGLVGKSIPLGKRSIIYVSSGLSFTYVFPYKENFFEMTKNNNGTLNNVLLILDNEKRFLTGVVVDLKWRRFSSNRKRYLGYGVSFNYIPQLLGLGNFRYENNKALSLGIVTQSLTSLAFEFELGLNRIR